MAIIPSLLDPSNYIRQENERRIAYELDISTEIYLAEKCTRIHYEDLMNEIPEHLASKEMLLGWVNDYVRGGNVLRPGIIRMYMKDQIGHFKDGSWQPLYFGSFVHYAAVKLTDKEFVNSKAKAQLFSDSFRDATWLNKASAVMGLKILEKLHAQRALKSTIANTLMDLNINNRELLDKNTRAIGRVFKNNSVDRETQEAIKDNFENYFKRQWNLFIKRNEQHDEYRIYDLHKQAIESAILEIPHKLQLSITGEQLEAI